MMKISKKILISTFAVVSAVSVPTTIAIAATSCSSSSESNKETTIKQNAFVNVVKELTDMSDFSLLDAEDMAASINEPSRNASIVAALKENKSGMILNPGSDLFDSNPTVKATANGTTVNIQISGIPNHTNQMTVINVELTGFADASTSTPTGYEINDWLPGDQFSKNGCTYEVILNKKRFDWENQPKYALRLTSSNLEEVRPDHLADDNTTGKVSSTDSEKGNICLPLLELGNNCISPVPAGANPTCMIGNGEDINIIIPETVVSIGDAVFYRIRNNVKTFKLNDRLEKVGKSAFQEVWYNGQLILPNSLEQMDWGSFSASNWTGELVIPPKIRFVPNSCFSWCRSITSISFAKNSQINAIDTFAFYVMYPIEDIYIPDTVKEIGDYCFGGVLYDAKRITISLPSEVKMDISKNYPDTYNFVRR